MADPVVPTTPVSLVQAVYERFASATATGRTRLGRPLTFGEKILFAHADDVSTLGIGRGDDYGDYRPDRVAIDLIEHEVTEVRVQHAANPLHVPEASQRRLDR